MKRVLIIQAVVKQYRRPFFCQLYETLRAESISLRVAYGAPSAVDVAKADNVRLPSCLAVETRNYWFFNHRLLYQPLLKEILSADLIIVEQANKHLLNYFLLLLCGLKLKKVAFWGHGRNLQGDSLSISERIKKIIIARVFWWFAYTKKTANYLHQCGVDAAVITVVQNSIDTAALKGYLQGFTATDRVAAREALGITANAQVAIFCGSLYEEKKIPFLIEAGIAIRASCDDFHLIILGAGPLSNVVKKAAAEHEWLHYLGPLFDEEKAKYLNMADVFMNPGLVGLSILDAFAAGLPMVTLDLNFHSPEIEYLENNVNGVIVNGGLECYVSAIVKVFLDENYQEALRQGALNSSSEYTLAVMVENFSHGILKVLGKS